MTKEETIDRIKVMQGYIDGKQIQFYDEGMRCWCDITDPIWDSVAKYRIKPEKKLRPYTFEEMCEAVKKHGVLVKSKDDEIKEVTTINNFDSEHVYYFNDFTEQYSEFLEKNVWFDDNSPCGIEEE